MSVWRDVLSYKDTQDKKDSSSGQPKDMKSSELHQHAVDLLQNCIQMDDVMLIGLERGEVKWNGKVIGILSNAECEEILWELSELNFRFELLALHL